MKNTIRRILTLSMLTASMTIGLVASAEPLPLPEIIVPPALPVPSLLSPPYGVEVAYNLGFTWSDIDADSYKLKVKNLDSGKKLTGTLVDADCKPGDFCVLSGQAIGLYDHVKDGDTVEWRVVAKFGNQKTKSTKRQVVMNTVSAPTTMLPANGSTLNVGGLLTWNHSSTNVQYTVVVKNAISGATAFKTTIEAVTCDEVCQVEPFDGVPFPQDDTWFTWRVKAKGQNGNKQKSTPFSFMADTIAAAV